MRARLTVNLSSATMSEWQWDVNEGKRVRISVVLQLRTVRRASVASRASGGVVTIQEADQFRRATEHLRTGM
jgi:hypothetical protein